MESFGLASAEVTAGEPETELACCWHPARTATETARVIAILDFMMTSHFFFPCYFGRLPQRRPPYVFFSWCEAFLDFNQLFLGQSGLPGLVAGLQRHVEHSEPDANLFEEGCWRFAAGKDPDEVVGELLRLAFDIENYRILFELHGSGVEDHFDLALANAFLDALRVAFLDAGEGFLAIGERDLVADLVRKAHGRLDGAVAPSHDEDSFIDVMIRFDQMVHDLRQFLSFNSEFPRTAALAKRKDYRMRAVLVFGGHDSEDALLPLLDVLHFLALAKFEIYSLQNLAPEGKELFLGEFHLLKLSVHWKFHGTRHHQFLARILRHRAPHLTRVYGNVIEFFLDGAQRSTDSRGAGSDDQHIVNVPD